jgi:hypothetical protein
MACPDWKGGDTLYNRKLKKTARFWGSGGYLRGKKFDLEKGRTVGRAMEWIKVIYEDNTVSLWKLQDIEYIGEYPGLTLVEGGRGGKGKRRCH